MREIKFRAWVFPLKEMKQVIDLCFNDDGEFIGVRFSDTPRTGMVNFRSVNLREYTGLKDKNGTEIFEGDVIKDEENFLWEVVYETDGFHVMSHDLMAVEMLREAIRYGEVVGNKYENPDILIA